MKVTKRIISILLAFLLAIGMVTSTYARTVTAQVSGTKGSTVTAEFKYEGILAINGTFTFSDPSMVSAISAKVSGLTSGQFNPNNGKINYYGTNPVDCTITLLVTLASDVKPGDTLTITFKYESTEDGYLPSIPDYQYDTVTVVVAVDYSALKAQIARAESLNEKVYTVSSWSKMRVALAAARKALLSSDQSVVDAATKDLKSAIDALVKAPIDYSALKKQIQIAEDLKEKDYTPSSWSKMKTALTAAKAALTSTSQATVDKATSNLKAAIAALVRISDLDYSELERQIARAEALNEIEYTPDSWAQMITALNAAKKALSSTEQSAINSAATTLKNAIDSLVRQIGIDYTELLAQIAIAEGLVQHEYTAASWKVLANALVAAKEATTSESQSVVNTAAASLKDAISKLVRMDYSALLAAIESVMKYAESEELADLWLQMHELLNRAQQLLTSGDQAAVDQCTQEIIDLFAKIVSEMERLKQSQRIEVEKDSEDDFCNIGSHRVWPILFWISLAINVALGALIATYLIIKRKRVSDDTPLVDYDIDDDIVGE